MSVPGTDITCEKCGCVGSTAAAFGIFKYSTPLGEISLPRTLGWCGSCRTTVPMEEISQPVRAESLASDLDWTRHCLGSETKSLRQGLPFLKRLLTSHCPRSPKLDELEQKERWLQEEVAQPEVFHDYLHTPRQPRCLECGSEAVVKMPTMPSGLNAFHDADRIKLPIGMNHPGCGGALLASTSNVRLNIRFTARVYDLNGTKIASPADHE